MDGSGIVATVLALIVLVGSSNAATSDYPLTTRLVSLLAAVAATGALTVLVQVYRRGKMLRPAITAMALAAIVIGILILAS